MAPTVQPIRNRKDWDEFLRLPWSIYHGDSNWVPPLLYERRVHINPSKNPYFSNAITRVWLARRNGKPVGRISAQVNKRHLEHHGDSTGHFGFLEAENSSETFQVLLRAASDWLRDQGLEWIKGPFSLSINDECGLLIDGFDTPPYLMMGHAKPYYDQRIRDAGLDKAKDLHCYRIVSGRPLSGTVVRFLRKASEIDGLFIRPFDMRKYDEEISTVVNIFNDAWSENWGFLPMQDEEITYLAKSLRPLVRSNGAAIAEFNGKPVAMAVCIPNLNEAIADLDGRLLPFGWAKLLWRIRVRSPKSVRMPLMGVRKKYQGGLIGAALAYSVINKVRTHQMETGVTEAELSWILEDNISIQRMIESFGGELYKTYRLYERAL